MDNRKKITGSLDLVLKYASENNFKGYNKYDALDSPILKSLSFNNAFIRLVYSQVVMRSPVNIRPLLLIPKTINPKGFGLFASTYLNLFKLSGDRSHLEQAEYFLNWLSENKSPYYPTTCWGYQYPWQDVGFYAKANLPNRVVTFFAVSAFLDAFDLTKDEKYLDTAKDAMEFMLRAPKVLFEDDTMKCLSYVPNEKINWVVMDVSALTASLASRVFSITGDNRLIDDATKLIRYVVDKQTDYGAWWYSHPPGGHTKMHDNYHTGYICDSILHYSENTGNDEFMPAYHTGIKYYKENLFLEDGTAKWMNNSVYPIDVHGSAQGIISFSKSYKYYPEYFPFAFKIAEWAIDHMQNSEEGYFYYQKNRLFRTPFTLMRWSNGWMALALSSLLVKIKEIEG